MLLRDYFGLLGRRWKMLASVLAVTLLISGLWSLIAPKTYSATSQVFFKVAGSSSLSDVNQGSEFVMKQMPTLQGVVVSPMILDPVIDKLKLSTTPEDLQKNVTTSVVAETVLMDITVEDRSADRAADIANAIADSVVAKATGLGPMVGQKETISAEAITRATSPQGVASPKLLTSLLIGLVAGTLLGVLAVLVAESRTPAARRAEDSR